MDLRKQLEVKPGHWVIWSWYGSSSYRERRIRVESWSSADKATAVAHAGLSYDGNSSTGSTQDYEFCVTATTTLCIGTGSWYRSSTSRTACSDESYAEAREDAIDAVGSPDCGANDTTNCCRYTFDSFID
jgi:hypothetical protein